MTPEDSEQVARAAKPRHDRRIWLAVVTIAAACVAAAFALRGGKPTREEVEQGGVPAVLRFKKDGFRYEYHVPSGGESLYDDKSDARGLHNLLEDHKAEAADCRRALERQYGVKSLDELRARYEETIRVLHSLGYL